MGRLQGESGKGRAAEVEGSAGLGRGWHSREGRARVKRKKGWVKKSKRLALTDELYRRGGA
jgi:hypothetical protein